MKIKPVILCGGSGTRLWTESENNLAKQFIDFGGWTLLQKTFERIKSPVFDSPIISTNLSYLNLVKRYLQKNGIKKYKIILEPMKKNTAPAILASALLDGTPLNQPMIFLPADHLIEKREEFNKSVDKNKKYLNDQNIFVFGIKPSSPSSEYGYFTTKKTSNGVNKVTKFIEKPTKNFAKKIINNNAYWNSGILFARKDSIINNFIKYQPNIYKLCFDSIYRSKIKKNVCYLNKNVYKKIQGNSFDYAILEKANNVNGIKLLIPWTDLGNWREISNIYKKNRQKYFKKKNVFYRPWGKYINLYNGKGFLIKEIIKL